MKPLNWKDGCKLLSELVILVIEIFQGQICHAAPLQEEVFERNDCQFLQCMSKIGAQRERQPTLSQVRPDGGYKQPSFGRIFET